jgi:uncharacterized membrane protein YgcG
LIKSKERLAKKVAYKGIAHSRIDNSTVGSEEYELNNWVWPAGFAEHYVRDNKVKPSDKFLQFIGYNAPTSSSSYIPVPIPLPVKDDDDDSSSIISDLIGGAASMLGGLGDVAEGIADAFSGGGGDFGGGGSSGDF